LAANLRQKQWGEQPKKKGGKRGPKAYSTQKGCRKKKVESKPELSQGPAEKEKEENILLPHGLFCSGAGGGTVVEGGSRSPYTKRLKRGEKERKKRELGGRVYLQQIGRQDKGG